MKRYVYYEEDPFSGDGYLYKLLRIEEAVPGCCQDFCETCGDCLACHGNDECFDGIEHYWAIYVEHEDITTP